MSGNTVESEEAATEILAEELPDWEQDFHTCEVCGDSGGASRLLQCDNCDDDGNG